MAAATTRTILFSTVRAASKVHTHAVAVFVGDREARAYGALLRLVHQSAQKEAILALDPAATCDDTGTPVTGVKLTMAIVPYKPVADLGDDDDAIPEA